MGFSYSDARIARARGLARPRAATRVMIFGCEYLSTRISATGAPGSGKSRRPSRGWGAVKILAISGSLQAGSSNGAVLRVARAVAPEGTDVDIWDGLAAVPPFNPDDEGP